MKAKISSLVLQIALILGAQQFVAASSFAQDAAPATDPAATVDSTAPVDPAAVDPSAVPVDPSAAPVSAESVAPTEDEAANAATQADATTTGGEHSGFGLEDLWAQGDVVARGTLIILLLMSAATWYVLITKLIQQQSVLSQIKTTRRFWDAKDTSEGLVALKATSPFRAIAEDGVAAAKQHSARQGEKVGLAEWVALQLQRSVERVSADLQTGLSLLATVGSCSPFVGLLGTVWGIYGALIAIGLSGQASIDKVAGPVGEALIMTAIGLGVAIPAVLGYNWLVRRNKVIVEALRGFAGDIHANLVMGVRGGNN